MKNVIFLIIMALSLFGSDYTSMRDSFYNGDTDRAIAYARPNATKGNVTAMYDLALLYYSKGDIKKAKMWFESSVNKNGRGKLGISLILFSQSKSERDYKKVIDSLKDIESGKIRDALMDVSDDFMNNKTAASVEKYLLLGWLFSGDEIIYINSNLTLLLIGTAANRGSDEALEIMGDIHNSIRNYSLVTNRPNNTLSTALYYYLQASNMGNTDAMAKMGDLYIYGPKNIRRLQYGIDFVSKAASKDSTLGIEMLEDLKNNTQNAQEYGQSRRYFDRDTVMDKYNLLFEEF